MKKFLVFSAFLSLYNVTINADSLKINNRFNDQIYVTIINANNDMAHALINSHSSNFINYEGDIDSIIINFQQPGIAPLTIAKDKIPAIAKLLTIFAPYKVSLS